MDAVFLDEYEKVNRALEQLGIRRKSLPPEARGRPRSTEGSIGGAVEYPEPRAPASGGKAFEKKGGEGKSFEYLFAKILAGPLSPAAATDGVPASAGDLDGHLEGTPAPSERGGEVQDIDEDVPQDVDRIVDISESFSVELSDRSVSTPPRTPNRTGARRIVKTPRAAAGSGTETASCTPCPDPPNRSASSTPSAPS